MASLCNPTGIFQNEHVNVLYQHHWRCPERKKDSQLQRFHRKWSPQEKTNDYWYLTVNGVRFVISKEDLTLGPEIRLDHSRAVVSVSQSVQSLSRVQLFETPWTTAHQAFLSITNSWSLLKLMPIESVMPSNHLILCHPLLLPPSIFPSIRVFSNESALCIRWPKYWSFSFSISPSNEHSGLISFRKDWLDLLKV